MMATDYAADYVTEDGFLVLVWGCLIDCLFWRGEGGGVELHYNCSMRLGKPLILVVGLNTLLVSISALFYVALEMTCYKLNHLD